MPHASDRISVELTQEEAEWVRDSLLISLECAVVGQEILTQLGRNDLRNTLDSYDRRLSA